MAVGQGLVVIGFLRVIYRVVKSFDKDSPLYRKASSKASTKCHLCLKDIRQRRWKNGKHRAECIVKNRDRVKSMARDLAGLSSKPASDTQSLIRFRAHCMLL